MEQTKELLQNIGIETFVKYYDLFKESADEEYSIEDIIEEFKDNGETWSENTMYTKARCGKQIFESELEDDALIYIISGKAGRIDDAVIKEARFKFEKELHDFEEKFDREMEAFDTAYADDEDYINFKLSLGEEPL